MLRRILQDRGTGRSLTSRDLAVLVDLGRDRDLAGRDLAVGRADPDLPLQGLVDLGRARDLVALVGRAARGRAVPDLPLRGLVDLGRARDLVALVGRAARGLAVRVDPDLALRHLAGLVGRADLRTVDLGDRVDPDLALRDPAGLVGRADRVDRAMVALGGQHRADLADQVGLGDRVDLGTVDLADLVGRADLPTVARGDRDLPDQEHRDLADPADQVDPHRRRTRPGVPSIGVAHRWADLRMRLTGSARPTTVRRLRPGNTDSGGMAGLLQERRRQTGTGRRLQVVGTVLRLPVVGTVDGMGRRAT